MEIRPNRIKQKIAVGEIAYVASGFTHPDDIDAFGPVGFDGIWLEGEHGPVDAGELGNLTRSCDIWGMTSVVRVNRNDRGLIYRTLDRGAQGIVVPHVNTKEEAQNLVESGKFAPVGRRGMFSSRQGYGVSNYFDLANNEIDVFFVAPSDLATSMGHIGNLQHPEVQNTIDTTLARIQDAGRIPGTLANNENVARYTEAGVRFLLTGIGPWLTAGAGQFKDRAENGVRPK